MDRQVFDRMAAFEESHWWFKARRDMIEAILSKTACLPAAPRILEAGCGTGGNLALLRSFGDVSAFEYDEDARKIASAKSGLPVAFGALPADIPFEADRFDAICLFDVLEHIKDDAGSLTALVERLTPAGSIIITVPAFPKLWSRHDERHHHFRRYTSRSLGAVARTAGLQIVKDGYFNSILMPLAVANRAINSALKREVADEAMPSKLVNQILYQIFAAERHAVGRLRVPAGLSLYAILQRL